MNYFCCTERRRTAILLHPTKNGIDFLEVLDDTQTALMVHFLKPIPAELLTRENIVVFGGERITQIEVTAVDQMAAATPSGSDKVLKVTVANPGDFSTYTLQLLDIDPNQPVNNNSIAFHFDALLSQVQFSFKATCPNDFDCEVTPSSSTSIPPLPQINYLAKDYASFRQLILDRMALLTPGWKERNPADLGMTLVELLSYTADYLSYRQDAIATEAYLGTARKRISVRRHARLVDYYMHDGCNARAWIQVKTKEGVVPFLLKKGSGTNTTKILSKTDGLPVAVSLESQKTINVLHSGAKVFEPMHDLWLYEQHNEIPFYTWGEEDCCLPKGATEATLMILDPEQPLRLKTGDFLAFIEKLGPDTGVAQDADISHRHVVRLTHVNEPEEDIDVDYYTNFVAPTSDDTPLDDQTVSIVTVKWDIADALPFACCISKNGRKNISVAVGNILLADHGMTINDGEKSSLLPALVPSSKLQYVNGQAAGTSACDHSPLPPIPPRFQPKVWYGPITHSAMALTGFNEEEELVLSLLNDQHQPQSANTLMQSTPRTSMPAITLWESTRANVPWTPRRDLLVDSAPSDMHFVVEIENDGTAYLRFGDDINGRRPSPGTLFKASYRIGNGTSGNVGAKALAHIASEDPSIDDHIAAIWNPLAAQGGKEAETIEEVKQFAPQAFRTQERAVTLTDYEKFTKAVKPDIQRATASYRWTGSWRTTTVTVDRLGGKALDPLYEETLRQSLEPYRMAGFDLQIGTPIYVSLEISMNVRVLANFAANDVRQVLLEVFSIRELAKGQRGVFHPDNFSFGESVYLSRIYTAAQMVQGVASVQVTTFQRQDNPNSSGVDTGEIILESREIARLNNDPNFPNHGLFQLTITGGR